MTEDFVVKIVERAMKLRRASGQRPLPAFISSERVDLLRLLSKVRELGGYSKTSGLRKWGSVAAFLGLPSTCGPSVKLVYLKYLKSLESGRVFTNALQGNAGTVEDVKPCIASTARDALLSLRRLAMDPGRSAAESPEFAGTLKGIMSGRRREEDHDDERRAQQQQERKARRGTGTSASSFYRDKYSLRSRHRHGLVNGQSVGAAKTRVPLGADFQAEVPATVSGMDDDSELFFGKLVWPYPSKGVVENGKSSSSNASSSKENGSRGCTKLLIAKQRKKLERELGEAVFLKWGFHRMGESLLEADHWSQEEEEAFASIVRDSCRGDNKEKAEKLWPHLQSFFAGKRSRTELVAYFFNVYMLRRRALQNKLYYAEPPNSAKFDSDCEDDGLEYELPTSSSILPDLCQVSNGVSCTDLLHQPQSCIKCSC